MNHAAADTPDIRYRRTFCRLCPAGCGMLVAANAGYVHDIHDIRGDKAHPMSKGYLCPKGLAAGAAHNSGRRLNTPLMRREGGLRATSWIAALDSIGADLAATVAKNGPDSVGFYFGTAAFFDSGAQTARTFAAKLNTRSWYTATSVDAPGWLLVAERMCGNAWLLPQPDPDARLAILIGTNPIISHGHNFFTAAPKTLLRSWAARHGLWVIDPRSTETASMATHHLRPIPGSEYVLLAYLVNMLLQDGADEVFLAKHGRHRDRLAAAVTAFDRDRVARSTGLSGHQIDGLLAAIRQAGRIAIHAGTGISMSRNANVATWLIWVLNLITGSMDRPGGLWFNRGMMRDWDAVGWDAVDTSEPGPRSRSDLPRRVGEMPSVAIADEIEAGNLTSLIVIGGNPVISLPDTDRLTKALQALDLLVVLDVVPTGTTELATHVLPCAGQFERSDLSLSEIIYPQELSQFTPAIMPPLADRKSVWWILGQIARRLGIELAPDNFSLEHDTAITLGVAETPRFDIADLIAQGGGWRTESQRSWGWVSRHLPGGRWNLAPPEFVDQLASAEPPRGEPGSFFLLASRQRHKVNSTLNDRLADPHGRSPPGLFINPEDAERLGLRKGTWARVSGPAGQLTTMVNLDPSMMPGCVSVPHGYETANVGYLTSNAQDVDTLSGMPVLTGGKVRIEGVRDAPSNSAEDHTSSPWWVE